MIVEYIQRSKGTMTFLKAFNLKETNINGTFHQFFKTRT